MRDEEDIEKILAKVIDLAIARGALKPNDRKGAMGQTLLHHGDKRAFLRKLLERRGGISAAQALAIEEEALAPPPPPPPSKPLPSLTAKKKTERKGSRRMTASSPLPSLNAPTPREPAKTDEPTVYRKGLPKLGESKKRDEEE